MRFYNGVDEKIQIHFVIETNYCITKVNITNISNTAAYKSFHISSYIFYDEMVLIFFMDR